MNFLIFILVFVVLYKVFISLHRDGFDGNCIKKVTLFPDSSLNKYNLYTWKNDPDNFKTNLDTAYENDISNSYFQDLCDNYLGKDVFDYDSDEDYEYYDPINCKLEYLK